MTKIKKNTLVSVLIFGLFALTLLSLTACKVGPNFESPEGPDTPYYTETKMPDKTEASKGIAGDAQYFIENSSIPNEWWKLFHSKELNYLIEKGMCHNQNIKAAHAALRFAEENYFAELGNLFPAVNASASASRQRFSVQTVGAERAPNQTFSLYNVSVNVSYVLDVFGGIRRQIEAQCAEVDYQRYLLEGTYLTLTANIVTTAITEASLRAQIEATHELIRLREDSLRIVKNQFQLGAVANSVVLAQETELARLRASLPTLEKSLTQTRHALAVLVGELPSESCLPRFDLDRLKLPRKLPVTLPSCLVRQRPDIKAQEALMHEASANIGVATANMLPQITLTGSYGYISNKLNNLFSYQNNVWNYGAQLVQPIFQGGTLIARRRAAIANYENAFALYKQTVLQAFQNVADSLRAIEMDAKALHSQTEAEEAAFATFNLVKQQYKLGAVEYLALLDAERQYQTARIERIKAQALRFSDTAALFQALGGGWWNCADFL